MDPPDFMRIPSLEDEVLDLGSMLVSRGIRFIVIFIAMKAEDFTTFPEFGSKNYASGVIFSSKHEGSRVST